MENINQKQKIMQTSKISSWTRVRPWLIILSALPVWIIVVIAFQILIGGLIAISIGENFFATQKVNQFPILWGLISLVIMTVSSVGVSKLYWVNILKYKFPDIGFTGKSLMIRELLYGLIVGVILQVSVFITLLYTHQIEIENISFSASYFLFYLVIYIGVAFNEELFFRGYLLGATMLKANKYVMLLIFAFVFSLVHFITNSVSLIPVLNIFLGGILLGIYFIHTKRLWFSISLHFFWNFIMGPVFGSGVSGQESDNSIMTLKLTGEDWMTGGEFGFEGSIIMTVVLTILILLIEILYRKNKLPSS